LIIPCWYPLSIFVFIFLFVIATGGVEKMVINEMKEDCCFNRIIGLPRKEKKRKGKIEQPLFHCEK
jgi:hypothetical protein